MRDIERKLCEAIKNNKRFKRKNTQYDPDTGLVHLHGRAIFDTKNMQWAMCGWGTVTTRSRLNALFAHFNLPFSVTQRDFKQCIIMHGDWNNPIPISSGEVYPCEPILIINQQIAA